jgi:delta-aminolevulinic acid dehydratase/porphobilinogen synthase
MLVTCSQMLYIKNKATQLLIITDLCLPKHFFPHGHSAHQTKVKKDMPSSFNMQIRTQKDEDNNCILLIYSYLYSIKHV